MFLSVCLTIFHDRHVNVIIIIITTQVNICKCVQALNKLRWFNSNDYN